MSSERKGDVDSFPFSGASGQPAKVTYAVTTGPVPKAFYWRICPCGFCLV